MEKENSFANLIVIDESESDKYFNMTYGTSVTLLTKEHIDALNAGKAIFLNINGWEYGEILTLNPELYKKYS